ncbi:MAG: hypothetical protein COA73_04735 [Candidatus Hydrogenedentota bacterium]|nr:MAG: hypothetical protein COA73_04735 [Candidatus Hydrogenedentota bacterium]
MSMNHNNIRIVMLLALLLLIPARIAQCDTLTLTSGDHLTGTLLNISEGTLSFRTTLAGRIFVPTQEVTQLSTSSFVVVALKDDQLIPGRIATQNNRIVIITPNNDARIALNLEDVASVATTPASEIKGTEKSNTIQGSIATGYKWRDGTKDASGPVTEITLDAQLKKIEIEASAEFEYTQDADSFGRFFDAEVRLQPNNEASIKPQAILEFERDRNQALDLRTDITLGANTTLLEGKKQRIDGFAGVGVSFEEYDSDDLRKDQNNLPLPPPGESSVSDQDLNLNLAVRYSRQWVHQSTIEKELIVRPSLSDSGDLRAELKSRLLMPLPLGMQLQLNLDLKYDNQSPYKDIDNWNTSFGASMRFDF